MIPDTMLSCKPHWYALSPATRAAIHATSHLLILHPRRRDALAAAVEEWTHPE
jgi:hypothetical protein